MALEINKYKQLFEEIGKKIIENLKIEKAKSEIDFNKLASDLLESQGNLEIFEKEALKKLFSKYEKELNKIDNIEDTEFPIEEKLKLKEKILFDLATILISKVFKHIKKEIETNFGDISEYFKQLEKENFKTFFTFSGDVENEFDYKDFIDLIFFLSLKAEKINIIRNSEKFEISFIFPANITLTFEINPFKPTLKDVFRSIFETFGIFITMRERDEEIAFKWLIQYIKILGILKLPHIAVIEMSKEKETISLIFKVFEDIVGEQRNIPKIKTKIQLHKKTSKIRNYEVLKVRIGSREDISKVFVNNEFIFVYEGLFEERLKTKLPYNSKIEDKLNEILRYCYKKRIVFGNIAMRNYLVFAKDTLLLMSEKYGIEIPESLAKLIEDGG